MGDSDTGGSLMGLQNRKRFIRLCGKYGLCCTEVREENKIFIYNKRLGWYPDRVGVVTFNELRNPGWQGLEELVVSLSVSTGAWME